MSNKYPYKGYTDKVTPAGAYHSNVIRNYQYFPTEKQMKYLNDLKKTCEREGIDLENFQMRTKTKNDVKGSIRALQTLLRKNGYYDKRQKGVSDEQP